MRTHSLIHFAGPLALAALASSIVSSLLAEPEAAFPGNTPIEITVLFPAGSSDVSARLLADRMSKRLGTNVIVVVRPGATPADHDTLDPRGLGFASAADVLNHTESGSNAVIHVGAEKRHVAVGRQEHAGCSFVRPDDRLRWATHVKKKPANIRAHLRSTPHVWSRTRLLCSRGLRGGNRHFSDCRPDSSNNHFI